MDDPLLDKMQALMGKYQTTAATADAPVTENGPLMMPDYDTTLIFPILTDIVKLGDAVFHDPQPHSITPEAATEISDDTANHIAQQVLQEVDAQFKAQIAALIAPRLQQAMDDTLAALLPQFTIHIEHIIHETLVKEFARHGITLKQTGDSV